MFDTSKEPIDSSEKEAGSSGELRRDLKNRHAQMIS